MQLVVQSEEQVGKQVPPKVATSLGSDISLQVTSPLGQPSQTEQQRSGGQSEQPHQE